jgi:hypothetical protein
MFAHIVWWGSNDYWGRGWALGMRHGAIGIRKCSVMVRGWAWVVLLCRFWGFLVAERRWVSASNLIVLLLKVDLAAHILALTNQLKDDTW